MSGEIDDNIDEQFDSKQNDLLATISEQLASTCFCKDDDEMTQSLVLKDLPTVLRRCQLHRDPQNPHIVSWQIWRTWWELACWYEGNRNFHLSKSQQPVPPITPRIMPHIPQQSLIYTRCLFLLPQPNQAIQQSHPLLKLPPPPVQLLMFLILHFAQ